MMHFYLVLANPRNNRNKYFVINCSSYNFCCLYRSTLSGSQFPVSNGVTFLSLVNQDNQKVVIMLCAFMHYISISTNIGIFISQMYAIDLSA